MSEMNTLFYLQTLQITEETQAQSTHLEGLEAP